MGKPYTQLERDLAFDAYYAMGSDRNFEKLCRRLRDVEEFKNRSPSMMSFSRWSVKDKWQARLNERDKKNSAKALAQTDREIVKKHRELVNTKADYRKDIRLALQPVKAAINKVIVKNKESGELELNIGVDNARDLASIVLSFEKLVKLDLGLIDDTDSSHWRKTRAKVLARDGYACTDCGSTSDVMVHHLTYEREGHELPEDLIALCRDCHSKKPKRTTINIQTEGMKLDDLYSFASKISRSDTEEPEE